MESRLGELGLSRIPVAPNDPGRPSRPFGRSGRVPDDFAPNPLARLLAEKRARGSRLLDLTVTNPTQVGLEYRPPATVALPATYEPEPRGSRIAREAIARYYEEREGRDRNSPGTLTADRLILTASTSESYAHLFRLLCDPGDEVLVPSPSYPLFEPLARLEGVEIHEYALRHAGPDDAYAVTTSWSVDLESLENAAGPRTRAILLVQPNNPTGSCVSSHELSSVEAFAEHRGLALVSDEVFGDFPWPPATRPLPSLLTERRRVLTFVLGGISKLCGLPQMKLGWIAVTGPDSEVDRALEGLEWIADLFLSTSAPIEAALPALLDGRRRFQTAVRERLGTNLELLRTRTPGAAGSQARDGGALQLLDAEGGWSAVLRMREHDAPLAPSEEAEHDGTNANLAERILERHDVLVHPGHFYGLSDEHIVISLIVEPPVLKEALDRMLG